MSLTREDFERVRLAVKQVACPGMDEPACIRMMTARARDAYDNSINDGERRDIDNLSARLVCLCLCDEDGQLLFPDPAEGAARIAEWPTLIVEFLFHECRKLNMMGKDAIEEAAKNLGPGPADSSSTD